MSAPTASGAGIAAGSAEAAAPLLAEYLYGKKAKDLTASEKSTISSIVGLAGSAVGATTGDVSSTVQGGQSAQNAVEKNDFALPINKNLAMSIQSAVDYSVKNNLSPEDTQKLINSISQPDDGDKICS
ncbi:VENN motif pre-toxin domain-containing protein [Acinetobacter colistiniresistens]|nr:VENN motif pre-toxin domain-containing protein [Acinetobacter colistiniresistens]UUM26414.1 VENN motif pre-toxin domain-containing protein [Acinetobacter colistiniresistens]